MRGPVSSLESPQRVAQAQDRASGSSQSGRQPPPAGIVTGSLRGEVEIQSIPELGVFLINGLDEDVAEVERIIRQIEEISEGRIPVVGVGGITGPEQAAELLAAGCAAVQLYSGLIFEGPGLIARINRGLEAKA